MRFSTVAVVAFSGLATAQSTIPACGKPCIDAATTSQTTCSVTDLACQCLEVNYTKILAAATDCVLKSCTTEALDVLAAATADCAALGDQSPPINPDTSVTPIDTATVTGTISISIIEATLTATLTSTSTLSDSDSDSSSSIEAPTGTPDPRPSTNGTLFTNSTATVSATATVVLGTSATASGSRTASTAAASTTAAPAAAGKMVAGSVGGVLAFGLALLAGL